MFANSSKLKIGLLVLLAAALVGGGYYLWLQKTGQAPLSFPGFPFSSPSPSEPAISLDNTDELTNAILAGSDAEIFSDELYADSELVVSDENSINELYQSYDAGQL